MMRELLAGHWITIHGLMVISGLIIYIGSSHTMHLRRHPSAAIAWVVTLVLIPYLALPLYLLFGSRKVGGHRPVLKKDDTRPPGVGATALTDRMRQLAAALSLPAASTYHRLNIHADGAAALRALRHIIDSATRTLDVCTFIFASDRLGNDIAECLKRRAGEGIRVRLLVDGVGAYLGGRTHFRALSAAGIQVVLFVPPLRSTLKGRTNLRNHRKMVVADGCCLWSGGRNLAAEYFQGGATTADAPWTDLSFDLQGALAVQAQQQFERDWQFAAKHPRYDPPPVIDASMPSEAALGQLIASGPDQMDDTLYALLVSGFFSSRKSILAVTPYFVPNPTLLMSLTLAARSGVAVDILMPRISNHRLADFARHRALRELTVAGARVWFLPHMIHAKAIVIDDEVALVGSANLDERSLFLNYEMMVAFYAPADVHRFSQWIVGQRHIGTLYREKAPGFWRELAEGLLLWLAFQL